ncbi:MAG: hypothetical protein MK179_16890 [Pirellulaceae bacterium]|nr:hypothetical protein [Pirellulaceae bacterium]
MTRDELLATLPQSAFAFRGYNTTNLGRSRELLTHPAYGAIVRKFLMRGSAICSEAVGRQVDLAERVEQERETDLQSYTDAISLIVSMELAQLELLREFFGIDYQSSNLMYGYSLGEIAAVVAGGVIEMEGPLSVLSKLADDAVELASDVTLGVLFSRGPALSLEIVQSECLRVNHTGQGVIGVSAYLSPNSLLLLGQADTLDRLKARLDQVLDHRLYLRKNKESWPPMHTPIVWNRNIPNRAAVMMHSMQGGFNRTHPDVFSLVTGRVEYTDHTTRDILCRWIDQPQRLWDAVYETLKRGIETVVHVGPAPNLIPATLGRLQVDVEGQTRGSIGMRALSNIIRRPWLSTLLPSRTALLRAPHIKQFNLEDWLLDQKIG